MLATATAVGEKTPVSATTVGERTPVPVAVGERMPATTAGERMPAPAAGVATLRRTTLSRAQAISGAPPTGRSTGAGGVMRAPRTSSRKHRMSAILG